MNRLHMNNRQLAGCDKCCRASVPNLFGTRAKLLEDNFFHGGWWGRGDGFGMIQAHYIQTEFLLCGLIPNRPGLTCPQPRRLGNPAVERDDLVTGTQRKKR